MKQIKEKRHAVEEHQEVAVVDDGAMPQTLKTISYSQAMYIFNVVTVNKCDKLTTKYENSKKKQIEKKRVVILQTPKLA